MSAITATGETSARFPRHLLPPMMLGAILNPINSSIIAVALVPIGAAFGAPASQTAWLVSALYLATSIGQPLVGRLVDLFGPKRLFLIGAALTGIAGVVGMLAPNLWVLVIARVILGFGTCAGYPSAMTLIRRVADRTGMASPAGVLTALSVTVQTIAVIGPTLGGILIDFGGWRTTMAINVPLAVACLAMGWWLLPSSADQSPDRDTDREDDTADDRPRPGLDGPGIVLFALTLVGLLLFLMHPGLAQLWALGIAVVAGAAFAGRELRTAAPFIDLRLLGGNLPLLATYARGLTAATTSYAFVYGFTQWLEQGRGQNATIAGLVLLPTFAIGIVVSTIFGRNPRVRVNLLVAGALQAVVSALLLLTAAGSSIWFLLGVTALLGIPQGLLSLSNQNALYHQAHPGAIGASSGLLRTFQYIGAVVASAAAGLAFGTSANTGGMHVLAWFMLAISVAAFLITLVDRSLGRIGTARR